ncbi:hypothetical protein HPB49_017049 [Dermacentor silvarum]|uniref:Uncharacterized protein n=1 Tax=Dermacentor silvarum TaxID=543639 RepID=A0ACB8DQT4_DERSI|nr:hypothetical protein HPB49_017049 [Dermacentor silvarum]
MNRPRYDVPPELTNLLLEFTVNVMIERPSDLVEYAARYFSGLRDERQRSASSGRPPAIAENDEAIYSDDEEPMPTSFVGALAREVAMIEMQCVAAVLLAEGKKAQGARTQSKPRPPSSRSDPLVRPTDESTARP